MLSANWPPISVKRDPLNHNPYTQSYDFGTPNPPMPSSVRITDASDVRITDAGDTRITD